MGFGGRGGIVLGMEGSAWGLESVFLGLGGPFGAEALVMGDKTEEVWRKKGLKNGILGLGGFFGVAGDVFGAEALIVGDSVGELCREKNSKKKGGLGVGGFLEF